MNISNYVRKINRGRSSQVKLLIHTVILIKMSACDKGASAGIQKLINLLHVYLSIKVNKDSLKNTK